MVNEELFQYWLSDMDDAINLFFSRLPQLVVQDLDYSKSSLLIIAKWLIENYQTINSIKKDSEKQILDGAARYIGQTFRKHLGGKWIIDYTNKRNVYFGLPQLSNMKGQRIQQCPYTMVTATIGRKDPEFLLSLLDNHLASN